MFNFEITHLGNLFFGLSLIVFISLFFVKNQNRDIRLHILLLTALGFIFYASDLITLFIGWEVMSWSSYFIISKNANIKTLQKYIIFNLAAGFALLAAIALIYGFSQSVIYSEIDISKIPHYLYMPISILLLITIFIKSGVLPFHYWVVDSYEEANHVFSAILSAIISKAGIFLFILFFTKIIGYELLDEILFDIVAWFGVITSIVATFKAISQDDLKRLLAYSSIAQLGYIVTSLAILSGSGVEAALYHTVIHTFVKLLLFINIASIIYITGRRKFSELGGLLYHYPTLFILLLIGIIALAGMPPLGGFNSKFLIYTTLLEEKKGLLLAAVMFSSASAFLYCYKLIYGIYLGQPTQIKDKYRKIPLGFYIPQFVGATILIVLGILPSLGTLEFNPILSSLGLDTTSYSSLFELNSSFASFNGGALMAIFGVVFVVVLAIVISMKNRVVNVRDRFDISYCGEVPDKDINLHYGYGIGEELKRISFIKVILKNSSSAIWQRVVNVTQDISMIVRRFYSLSSSHVGLVMILFFTILLFIGVAS
jgi:NADH-quinone oxidoreductase subunit M